MTNKIRQQRKDEHLKIALSLETGPQNTGFDDVEFIHQAISDLDLDEIDTAVDFIGQKLKAPFLIEAITGGTPKAKQINKCLAEGARKMGIAMAVGSQTIAVEEKTVVDTFAIVREYNPQGVILANVGAGVPVDVALQAIEMIQADGVQLHLNLGQELLMEEGDRSFNNSRDNIKEIIRNSPVPVIIKEVGFGISRETVLNLYGLGAKYIDIGGAGGTNFAAIENKRRSNPLTSEWYKWGIPTVASLLECLDANIPINIIASGGIDSGIKAAKALALGANLAGAALPFLKSVAFNNGSANLVELISSWTLDLKMCMLLAGAKNLTQLRQKPLIIKGESKDWATKRGIKLQYGLK